MKLVLSTTQPGAELSVVLPPLIATIKSRGHRAIFVTVSPNPSTAHEVKPRAINEYRKNFKVSKVMYQYMTHQEQYDYIIKYLRKVYTSLLEHDDWMYIVFELNQQNNLHAHAILYSPSLQNEYDIRALQKTVYSDPMTIHNLSRKMKTKIDYMNSIFYIDHDKLDEKVLYIQKDMTIKKAYPDQFVLL